MRQINLFKDILEYIGMNEHMVIQYENEVFENLNADEIKKIDDYELARIIAFKIEQDINLYFDSDRNSEIK